MRGCGLPERIGEPTQARLPELEHLDQVIVNAVQRSRRTDRARLVGELTLLCGQAPDPRLESGLLDPRGGERTVQPSADLRRVRRQRSDLVHVVRVRGVLA